MKVSQRSHLTDSLAWLSILILMSAGVITLMSIALGN
jgi:hypothetical protein